MVERLEPIVRCLRVLYVSAGKGSMLLTEVTQDIASNPRMTMSQPAVEEHVKFLIKVIPWSFNWIVMILYEKNSHFHSSIHVAQRSMATKLWGCRSFVFCNVFIGWLIALFTRGILLKLSDRLWSSSDLSDLVEFSQLTKEGVSETEP